MIYDAELFRITGNPYWKIVNFDCTALSSYVYRDFLSSSESSSDSSIESSLSDESKDTKLLTEFYEMSYDPQNVTVSSLKSLLSRYELMKVSIFKYGAATNLIMSFIK